MRSRDKQGVCCYRGPVEDLDFISCPGKILDQVTTDIACTACNQDTH
jgi:hypothetical protein